jgi:hypothetical protein
VTQTNESPAAQTASSDQSNPHSPTSYFILHTSYFILHTSSFFLLPSSFFL